VIWVCLGVWCWNSESGATFLYLANGFASFRFFLIVGPKISSFPSLAYYKGTKGKQYKLGSSDPNSRWFV